MSKRSGRCRIHPRPQARQQRGVVLLVVLLVTIVFGGYFGVKALNSAVSRDDNFESEAQKLLSDAKAALLAWSVTTDDSLPTITVGASDGLRAIRPGNLPYPDLAQGLGDVTPSDGIRDHGCARRTWPGTTALLPITKFLSTGQKTRMRCLGRLPLQTLGLHGLATDTNDTAGKWPWYVVSANLVNLNLDCPYRLDGATLNAASGTLNCGTTILGAATAPFPWITVRDPFGNIISSRVAAVVIVPGPVTTRQPGNVAQVRAAGALPSAYLDTVDNAACTGGRCDNALLTNTPMNFIQCVAASSTAGDARFNANYACNDRLTYITIDELMNHAAMRMEREFVNCLRQYAQNNGGLYPWAGQANDPSAVAASQTAGSFPSNDLAANPTCTNQGVYWGSWQIDAAYTVSLDQRSAQLRFNSFPSRSTISLP